MAALFLLAATPPRAAVDPVAKRVGQAQGVGRTFASCQTKFDDALAEAGAVCRYIDNGDGRRSEKAATQTQSTRDDASQPIGQPISREALLEGISKEQLLLERLDREQADARSRLATLHGELALLGAEPEIRVPLPVIARVPVPKTSAEKVKLFRSLLRGRADIFPTQAVVEYDEDVVRSLTELGDFM